MNISASPDPVMIGSSNYEGKVPVTVTLAPTSLSSPTLPPPIHVLLPRSTYLEGVAVYAALIPALADEVGDFGSHI